MSTNGYIITSWVGTFVVVIAYAAVIIRRGRTLSRSVPPERRRWM